MNAIAPAPRQFIPSTYQQAVFDWVVYGQGSCVMIAVAGSGKSTTIEHCLPLIPETALVKVLVFSADIAKDWKQRIANLSGRHAAEGRSFHNVSTGTFHGMGFSAVCRRLNLRADQVTIDTGKCRKILRENLGELDMELYADFACKLVGFAKGEGIGALVPDTEDRWFDLIRHHDLSLDSEDADEVRGVDIARKLLWESCEIAKQGIIDYDDQLYLVAKWRLSLRQHDFVFVDEAQDTSPIRRALVKLALAPGGRLIAVGDPSQGIFGFTGASHNALNLIKAEFNCIELPLTVSYRCPQAVVRQAQTIVSHIEAAPGAIEGVVNTLDINDALKLLDAHDAILCRQTAPLVSLAFGLIARGRGCTILGKDIGQGLVKLVKSMKAGPLDPVGEGNGRSLIERLAAYQGREVAKHMAKGEEQKAESVTDKVNCILTVIDALPENARNVQSLVYRIEKMFSDTNGVLTLATQHKSKGKEWAKVAILQPELNPSKWARQDHQMKQEQNLMYVAWTRAMEHLMFLEGELK